MLHLLAIVALCIFIVERFDHYWISNQEVCRYRRGMELLYPKPTPPSRQPKPWPQPWVMPLWMQRAACVAWLAFWPAAIIFAFWQQ